MKSKQKKLINILIKLKRVLVAYSGGTDSTLLLAVAVKVLGRDNVLAITALSETYPQAEYRRAKNFLRSAGVPHTFLKTDELSVNNFVKNSKKRCYYCKNELFKKLSLIAKKNNMALCDGTNFSDRRDFRPGKMAAKKWGVQSPLLDSGLTKEEIRQLSKKMKLPTWNLPAQACLASRFPYGAKISKSELRRIDKAETLIRNAGVNCVRLRHHGDIARLEIGRNEIKRFINSNNLAAIVGGLKKMGWKFITLDIDGYRTGSLN